MIARIQYRIEKGGWEVWSGMTYINSPHSFFNPQKLTLSKISLFCCMHQIKVGGLNHVTSKKGLINLASTEGNFQGGKILLFLGQSGVTYINSVNLVH